MFKFLLIGLSLDIYLIAYTSIDICILSLYIFADICEVYILSSLMYIM